MPNNMDYSLIHHSPDGTGMFLVTLPGTPDRGSYMTEQEFKEWIVSSIGGGIVPKGDILSSNLPPADASNKGWQYYCTDLNKYAISDGTAWIYFSNSPITQTPDATDTGHALSNAVVTQCCNEVKGRLDQHDARLQNLEQKAGDYSIVQYRGTNAVPTGKAKYGLVKSIVGKTRAWNQFVQASKFPAVEATFTNGSRVSAVDLDNMTITITVDTGGATADRTFQVLTPTQLPLDASHVYLMTGCPNGGSASTYYVGISNVSSFGPDFGSGGILQNYGGGYNFGPRIVAGCPAGTYTFRPRFTDLTLIFPEGVPSTIAECVQKCPDLLKWDELDAGSLVDTVVSGVESKARNLFNINDFDSINGYFNDSVIASGADRKIVYVPCKPNTVYCATRKAVVANERFSFGFSSELPAVGVSCSNIVSATPSQTIGATMTITATSPSDAKYLVCWVYWDNTTSALDSLCINKSDSLDGTFTPFFTDTLSLSTPVTLRSAGSASDELAVESGVVTHKIYKKTFSASDGWELSGAGNFFLEISDMYQVDYTTQISLLAEYAYDNTNSSIDKTYWNNGRFIFVRDTSFNGDTSAFASALAGKKLNYALATSTTESIDPVPDNTILTEDGGTIDTIQTQSPVIDNCLDVGYLTV